MGYSILRAPQMYRVTVFVRGGLFGHINGVDANTFEKSIMSPAIAYVFVEQTGEVRKIGEGLPNRILANLRAHYNHGTTKAGATRRNRLSGNSIARQCRLAGDFILYLKWEVSKEEAQKTQAKLKSLLCGWLDYDQGGRGVPSTV